jgi:biotin synthase
VFNKTVFNNSAATPVPTGTFRDLAERLLQGEAIGPDAALALLRSDPADYLDLLAAAAALRRRYFGNRVKLNYLVNLKSGLCPEDCSYCSQRLGSAAQILKYTWLTPEEAISQAEQGLAGGASRVCFVASGRGPADRDVDRVAGLVGDFKTRNPQAEVCACLGILKDGQAERLKACGVDAYNHNLNTSESKYSQICTSHEFSDRTRTVEAAKTAGLSPCSGLIVGMGESDEEIVEALFALRELGSESVPVNFLMPFEGTPLADTWLLDPVKCLQILCVARFVAPQSELRIAGGREMHLRSLQAMALHVANSIFLGDYLTSEGQSAAEDLAMIQDAGFVVLDAAESRPDRMADEPQTRTEAGPVAEPVAGPGQEPVLRRRGAGTARQPNA